MVGLLDFFTGGDPEQMAQIDPRYGVPRADVRDAAVNTLGNISALLLAAGQPITPAQRAQLIAQIGPAAGGGGTDLYNAAQRRLMTAQMEQRRGEVEETRRIGELLRNPERFRAETGLDPQQFAGMRAANVSQALRQIAIARGTPRPPITLRPGETAYDPRTNQPLFTAPAAPDSGREQRIQDIMRTFNVDRATALGIVDNIARSDTDPVTGQPRRLNLITGQSQDFTSTNPPSGPPAPTPPPATPPAPAPAPAPTPAPAPAAAAPRPPQTLYELARTPFTTGVAPAVAQAAQGLLGQVGANVVPPELTERRQAFGNAQGELIRSLAINPRFPVAAMERIRSEINIEPGLLVDPQTLQARMRSIDGSLRTRLANEERAANDVTLPVETRRNAATAANDIRNFLTVLGVPQTAPTGASRGGSGGGASSAAPPVPRGVNLPQNEWNRLWGAMTAEERALWQN